MRSLVAGVLALGILSFLPQTAAAQPCQTHDLPELVTITGTLSATDCVVTPYRNSRGEFWNVYANTGDTLIITMNRVTMSDPYLYLLDPSGVAVASNDDAVMGGLNSRIQYVATVSGRYKVVATTFILQPNNDFGTFEIRVEIPGHAACQIRSLPVNTTINATLDTTDCIVQPYRNARGEFWTLTATAGDSIVINMNRFTLSDPYLFLLDSDWQVLTFNDDTTTSVDSRISFTAPYTGTYRVIATAFGSSSVGAYSIRFDGGPPPPPSGVPGPPGQPSVAGPPGNNVTLSWTAPTTGGTPILEYILDVGSTPGGTEFGSYSMGQNLAISAIFPNGTFYVRVRARNSFGTGPASAERSFVVGTLVILSPPRNLTYSIAGRAVTINWLAPIEGPPDLIRIEIGSSPGLTNIGVIDIPGTFTTAGNPNAPPGIYYVRLRAVRGTSTSAPSNEVAILVF